MIQVAIPRAQIGTRPCRQVQERGSTDLLFDRPGRLAYANAGPTPTARSFFITEVATTASQRQLHTLRTVAMTRPSHWSNRLQRMATDPSNDRPFRLSRSFI